MSKISHNFVPKENRYIDRQPVEHEKQINSKGFVVL